MKTIEHLKLAVSERPLGYFLSGLQPPSNLLIADLVAGPTRGVVSIANLVPSTCNSSVYAA